MRFLRNRIILSFVAIFLLAYLWEFWVKPETSPIYTEAVAQYRNKDYHRSLELLQAAYNIDPNNTATLTLMGWDYVKLDNPEKAEPLFRRARLLAHDVTDLLLGYAYAEIELKKYEEAAELLNTLKKKGEESADVHIAWATLYRKTGRNQDAGREFQLAMAIDEHDPVAIKNLQEIYNVKDVRAISLTLQPLVRPPTLTYAARVSGEHLEWQTGSTWKPAYLVGVDLSAALPGHYSTEATLDPDLYADWFRKMSELGINTIRIYDIMPPAFYRSLYKYNTAPGHAPLRLLQGISFGDLPPQDDMFNHQYYADCQKAIHDAIDVIHGQGDVAETVSQRGGIFPNDVAPWVTGFVLGTLWLSHVVTDNNALHPDIQNLNGPYIQVPSGSPTEVFLAQMLNYAAQYEESRYNWQHPIAFLNWPTLDPMRHPTESTMMEEVSIRRGLGERFPNPEPPYDDDDGVSVDPMHFHSTDRLAAGYFAAYSVFPFYPEFMVNDPRYLSVRDSEGSDPYLGYLQDLKTNHRGVPLVITEYGIPSSLGIGHFSPAGMNQGGETETQQGQVLARMTRNIYEAGAAGGFLFEWLDEWFRQTWLVRNFETPRQRSLLWTNFMDPSQYYGILGAFPREHAAHRLDGNAGEWADKPAIYTKSQPKPFQPIGDRYDPARNLVALYADADEAFLYLRLVVEKLDNDNDGKPDWPQVSYLIGISTSLNKAGLTSLPFIGTVRFPMGMTYAVQLAGPELSRIWIASSYNPYRIAPVEGVPSQTVLGLKLGWQPTLTDNGTFESQVIEPNRRRFGRDGKYYAPQRYDRGILRYGDLDPNSPDYDTLAEFHANVRTNTIDLRIPWNLLNVTDPSSFQVFAGLERDGTVKTVTTPGFRFAVLSYRPLEAARVRPIMEQAQPVADALPGMTGPTTIFAAAYKDYLWKGWETPESTLKTKDSYGILHKAFLALPTAPPSPGQTAQQVARTGGRLREGKSGEPGNPVKR